MGTLIPVKVVTVIRNGRLAENPAWDESKHKRQGGKFATTNGPGAGPKGYRPGDAQRGINKGGAMGAATGALIGAAHGYLTGGAAGAIAGGSAGIMAGGAAGGVAGLMSSGHGQGRAAGLVKDVGKAQMDWMSNGLKAVGIVATGLVIAKASSVLGPKLITRIAQSSSIHSMAKIAAAHSIRRAGLTAMVGGGVIAGIGAGHAVGASVKGGVDLGKAAYNFVTGKHVR